MERRGPFYVEPLGDQANGVIAGMFRGEEDDRCEDRRYTAAEGRRPQVWRVDASELERIRRSHVSFRVFQLRGGKLKLEDRLSNELESDPILQ